MPYSKNKTPKCNKRLIMHRQRILFWPLYTIHTVQCLIGWSCKWWRVPSLNPNAPWGSAILYPWSCQRK